MNIEAASPFTLREIDKIVNEIDTKKKVSYLIEGKWNKD